ncbi:adenylate cyclase, terminal-differentiation specific-like [Diaphorina citri]|uniref:Adenylate cyclase, terminal-differentiation specific-like n=1 Tax=Diaphorina citri TaxID=121845 RepID=A0A3Q0IJP5_DIACI|nr:adenylate cyclase, terminal-differentiation specific-like [Diaphorina citri]
MSEICYQTERDKVANELNRKILKLNPFIWSSFEMLCNRTELPPPVNPKPSMNHTLSTPLMTNHSVQQNLSTPANNTTDKTGKLQSPLPPLQGSQNTVRRSSRLFTISNNNYSVKENNKSPNRNNKFATPKSPSKKTKSKLSKSSNGKPVVTYDNERNLNSGGGGGGETDQSNAGGVMSAGGYSREQMLSVQKHVASKCFMRVLAV